MSNRIINNEEIRGTELSESTPHSQENENDEKSESKDHRRFSAVESIRSLVNNKVNPMKLPPIRKVCKNKINSKSKTVADVFEVKWKNLSYIVEKKSIPCIPCQNPSMKIILKSLSGSFKSSQLTAVMGPSGAGKSTLLSCVCGKLTNGVKGEIQINGCNKIKVAIISQDDYLTDKLTVKEALIFASKVKNHTEKVDHEEVIKSVVKDLCLEKCLNTRCGRCSGGQRRKISIALELVSKPNILILDEPTSGLDSSACYQIVSNLKDLTQQKRAMAIVATIHQPSARVFNLFDNIYVISHNGQCIYHGSPGDLLQQLSEVDLTCPTFYNPADYIAELASGEYGIENITKLSTHMNRTRSMRNNSIDFTSSHTLAQMSQKYKLPAILHTILLIKRSFKLIPREPHLSWIRLISHTMIGIFIGLLFGADVGSMSGCPPRMQDLYNCKASELFKNFEYESKRIENNLSSIFFNVLFLLFAGLMPMLMVFPSEVNVFIKQYTNGWYSPFTYFISKIISDLPILITVSTIYLTIWYLLSDQIFELWRYCFVIIIGILIVMIGQSQGIICSAIYSTNLVKASFIGTLSTMPFILLAGFFVRTKRIPLYLRPVTYLAHTRYAFESLVITLYGFNRCFYHKSNITYEEPSWLKWLKFIKLQQKNSHIEDYNYEDDNEGKNEENAMKDILAMLSGSTVKTDNYDEYQSMVLSRFEFTDDMLYFNIITLASYVFIFEIIAYYILLWRVKHSNQ